MLTLRRVVVGVLAASLVGLATSGTAVAASSTSTYTAPVLTAVRVAHTPAGNDRVVFQFTGKGPSSVSTGYVNTLVGEGSGLPISVSGQAVLKVTLRGADAHTTNGTVYVPTRVAYTTPNVITTVRTEFEGVISYGIGLAQKSSYSVFRLSNPARVVVDVRATFPTVTRAVYFTDTYKITHNDRTVVTPVYRQVPAASPARGVMDRLYAGPTPAELNRGLRFTASGSTGYANLSIYDRVARVRLLGTCSSGGSAVVTVASEIMPTLKQFSTVRWVKIYDQRWRTERPYGHSDSIPFCLEP